MDTIYTLNIIGLILFLLFVVLPIARIYGKVVKIVALLESINGKLGKGQDDIDTNSAKDENIGGEDDPLVIT